MAEQLNPSEAINKMLDDANATEDVRRLVPMMGRQLVIQLTCPLAMFKKSVTGNGVDLAGFTNAFLGVIQPSEMSDRVFIISNNMGAIVKATDVQIVYVPMPEVPKEEHRIITMSH